MRSVPLKNPFSSLLLPGDEMSNSATPHTCIIICCHTTGLNAERPLDHGRKPWKLCVIHSSADRHLGGFLAFAYYEALLLTFIFKFWGTYFCFSWILYYT